MKSFLSVLFYMLMGLLCAWYLVVIYWSFNPNVGLEYRLYYIEKELSDWPGYGGLSYKWSEKLYFGTETDSYTKLKNRGKGWEPASTDGAWAVGEEFDLIFVLQDEVPSEGVILQFEAAAYDSQRLDLYINNRFAGEVEIVGGDYYLYEVLLTEDVLGGEELMVVRFVNRIPPGNEDIRGVFFVWIDLSAVS